MSDSNRDWAERLHDEELRVGSILWLAGALADGMEDADPFDDFWLDLKDGAELLEVFPDAPPELVELAEGGDSASEELPIWLLESRKLGFLLRFETPVMSPLSNGGRSFSWGMYTTRWAYGDTIAEACEKGLKWAAGVRAKEEKGEKEA